MQTKAYAAQSATTPLGPHTIDRREPGPRDVALEILFCGVCHSDLHTARSEWPGTKYPCVPGHEIVGRVTGVGAQVDRFKPGDLVMVRNFKRSKTEPRWTGLHVVVDAGTRQVTVKLASGTHATYTYADIKKYYPPSHR